MAQGFLHGVDLLTAETADVWPALREDLAFETLERQWCAAAREAVRRLTTIHPEERRRISRNKYGEGGFNPTNSERRGVAR